MKKCPKCEATVQDECICHICGENIIDQPEIEGESGVVFNKYYAAFLIKKCAFSAICIIGSAIMFALKPHKPGILFIISVILLACSAIASIIPYFITELTKLTPNRNYAGISVEVAKYATAIIGVICMLVECTEAYAVIWR